MSLDAERGNAIKQQREHKELSQAHVAEMLDIGLTTYNRYERGLRPIPMPIASRLAEILGMSLEEIAGQAAPPSVSDLVSESATGAIASRIVARRQQLGISASQIAASADIKLEEYQRYETGEEHPPLAVAAEIAEALDISLLELAGKIPKSMDFNGRWWAAWQGTGLNSSKVDRHNMTMLRAGDSILVDDGWRGVLQVFRNEVLLGWYRPPVGTRSQQGVYLWFPTDGDYAYGRWTGINDNNSIGSGWCVIAREEAKANELIERLVADNTQPRAALRLPPLSGWGT